jgi:ketosteroid isomerase-like protein
MHRVKLVTGLSAVVGLGCARGAAVNLDTEREALRQLDAQFGSSAAKKDSAGAVALYGADAVIMPPNAPAVKGTAAIRTLWSGLLQTPGLVLRVEPEKIDVAPSGDFATDMGTVTLEFDGPQGHVKEVDKYLEVWQKRDGTWRVIYDTWNANSPPAPSEPKPAS